jgi:Anti-sigma-28 factor, FlgM
MKPVPAPIPGPEPERSREERIQELRQQIEDGTYRIDSAKVAEAIVKRHLVHPDPDCEPEE